MFRKFRTFQKQYYSTIYRYINCRRDDRTVKKLIKKRKIRKHDNDNYDAPQEFKFELPEEGGAMVHSDLHQTDNINVSVPESDVKVVWYKNKLKGERTGTLGNGIAGNGKIAVNTFNGERDNLVIYDYEGNHLWTSGDELNFFAGAQTPIVDKNGKVIICDNRKIMMIGKNDDEENEILWK